MKGLMKVLTRKSSIFIFMSGILYSSLCLSVPIVYNYSDFHSNGQLNDQVLFGGGNQYGNYGYQIKSKWVTFALDENDSTLAFSAFDGVILQPNFNSVGVFTFDAVPMSINGYTQYYNFSGQYQNSIVNADNYLTQIYFNSLPEVIFDLGTSGILVGSWQNSSVSCSANTDCTSNLFPSIKFTRQEISVAEPATLTLLILGLLGIGFNLHKKTGEIIKRVAEY